MRWSLSAESCACGTLWHISCISREASFIQTSKASRSPLKFSRSPFRTSSLFSRLLTSPVTCGKREHSIICFCSVSCDPDGYWRDVSHCLRPNTLVWTSQKPYFTPKLIREQFTLVEFWISCFSKKSLVFSPRTFLFRVLGCLNKIFRSVCHK